jgi:MFS transporter, DHA2 family, lincomycin resistance protein
MLMMVSLAATFTPVFTLGLGALPMHLYSHGSSILGTLQQVAAAFGTALAVTVMTLRAEQVLVAAGQVQAQLEGMQAAFAVSALISLVVVAMAWLLPGRPAAAVAAVVLATDEPAAQGTLEDELEALCAHGLKPASCNC